MDQTHENNATTKEGGNKVAEDTNEIMIVVATAAQFGEAGRSSTDESNSGE